MALESRQQRRSVGECEWTPIAWDPKHADESEAEKAGAEAKGGQGTEKGVAVERLRAASKKQEALRHSQEA